MNLDSKGKNRARNPPRWIPAMIVVGNHPNMACFTTTIMSQNISSASCRCNPTVAPQSRVGRRGRLATWRGYKA